MIELWVNMENLRYYFDINKDLVLAYDKSTEFFRVEYQEHIDLIKFNMNESLNKETHETGEEIPVT